MRRVNKIKKGKRFERNFRDYLMKKGYLKEAWIVPSVRWGKKDLFNLFDIVGITKSGYLFLAQIKANKNHIYSAWKKINKWVKGKAFTEKAIILVATFDKKAKRWRIRTNKEFYNRLEQEGFKLEQIKGGGAYA